MVKINTFVFVNVGSDSSKSVIKLNAVVVTRNELSNPPNPDGSYGAEHDFEFDDLDDEYYDDNLKYEWTLAVEKVTQFNNFLTSLQQPVALVSYNGYRYQYNKLKQCLVNLNADLPPGILCTDIMHYIYEKENNLGPIPNRADGTLPWYKIQSQIKRTYDFEEVYKRVTDNDHIEALNDIALTNVRLYPEFVKVDLQAFLEWADSNSTLFANTVTFARSKYEAI